MTASVSSPADVINLALVELGHPGRVGNLYDGSAAAKKALDVYAQTRDELLRQDDWDFAQKFANAALTGNPAPPPWTVEYTYPADCLKLRNLYNALYFADTNDPLPVLWTVGSSGFTGNKVIWCKLAAGFLVYTAQITDPAKWEPLFVDALAAALAKRLGPVLKDLKLDPAANEKDAVAMAESTIG